MAYLREGSNDKHQWFSIGRTPSSDDDGMIFWVDVGGPFISFDKSDVKCQNPFSKKEEGAINEGASSTENVRRCLHTLVSCFGCDVKSGNKGHLRVILGLILHFMFLY